MQLPQQFLDSLTDINGFDREAFVQVHNSGEQVTSIRLNRPKWPTEIVEESEEGSIILIDPSGLAIRKSITWSLWSFYLSERPSFTLDPRFHGGYYYVQEASGTFLEQAVRQVMDLNKPVKVLDLCAAPGGKSTLLQSIISHASLLVSNEVIKSRAVILEENLTKWGGMNAVITNNDPKDFARLENFFDLMVVDAPCSGSGLFRRDPEAINEWSLQNVQLCHQRQQRILADAYPALNQDGVLIYCTCSYSKEENEDILDWLCSTFALSSIQLSLDIYQGIVEVQSDQHKAFGYRFWPDKVEGEGFFIACLRKQDGDTAPVRPPKKSSLQKLSKNETVIAAPWINKVTPVQLWKQGDLIFAFPPSLEKELLIMAGNAYIRMAGVKIGKIAGEDLIPDHALAVSTIISDEIVAVSLKREDALQYLRKEEVNIETSHRGWALVQFEQFNLGWIKILSNRINNYYPKEWRILKKF